MPSPGILRGCEEVHRPTTGGRDCATVTCGASHSSPDCAIAGHRPAVPLFVLRGQPRNPCMRCGEGRTPTAAPGRRRSRSRPHPHPVVLALSPRARGPTIIHNRGPFHEMPQLELRPATTANPIRILARCLNEAFQFGTQLALILVTNGNRMRAKAGSPLSDRPSGWIRACRARRAPPPREV